MGAKAALWVALFEGLFGSAHGWYLPGVAPHDFARGEEVVLKVNKLSSTQTQIPYDYYSLPFCKPEGGVVLAAENLGEFLTGDRIENSPYKIFMRDEMHCEVLCQQVLTARAAGEIEQAVEEGYHHNWIIDNLPAASVVRHSVSRKSSLDPDHPETLVETAYAKGFPVGYRTVEMTVRVPGEKAAPGAEAGEPQVTVQSVDYYVHNHVDLTVLYHSPPDEATNPKAPDRNRVVGVFVAPRSVKHRFENGQHWTPTRTDPSTGEVLPVPAPPLATCSASKFASYDPADLALLSSGLVSAVDPAAEPQRAEAGTVLFTYGVHWERSDVRWASRWDIYLALNAPSQVHWFSIANAVAVVVLLSALVAMVVTKAVSGDIARYNSERPDDVVPLTEQERDEERQDAGWKLVHRRVFAPPPKPALFCAAVGTGAQLLAAAVTTLFLASLGFLSPANRGSLAVAALCLFCLYASGGGFVAARLHRTLAPHLEGALGWAPPGLLVALAFPGLAFLGFAAANAALHAKGSTAAVPVPAAFALAFFWLAVAAPLALAGAAVGHGRFPPIELPVPVDPFPRPIPDKPWVLGWVPTMVVGGALPFGACYVELYFVLDSLWTDSYYYLFGFLFLALLLLVVTVAEVAVVLTYFLLCAEDPRWWWRAFACAAATGLFVLYYSAVFFARLEANQTLTYVLYFGYMGLGCLGVGLMCGAVGFAASFWFVVTIYGSIKVD